MAQRGRNVDLGVSVVQFVFFPKLWRCMLQPVVPVVEEIADQQRKQRHRDEHRAAEPDRLGHKPFRKVEMCEWRAKRLQNKSIKADSEPATKLIGPPARK